MRGGCSEPAGTFPPSIQHLPPGPHLGQQLMGQHLVGGRSPGPPRHPVGGGDVPWDAVPHTRWRAERPRVRDWAAVRNQSGRTSPGSPEVLVLAFTCPLPATRAWVRGPGLGCEEQGLTARQGPRGRRGSVGVGETLGEIHCPRITQSRGGLLTCGDCSCGHTPGPGEVSSQAADHGLASSWNFSAEKDKEG